MPYVARFNPLSTVLLLGITAALCTAAPGQDYPKPKAFDPNLREVALVKQDFSDCENSNVSPSGYVGGTAWVVPSARTAMAGARSSPAISSTAAPTRLACSGSSWA